MILFLAVHAGGQTVFQKRILPAFQKYWLEKTDQKVEFKELYAGSGTIINNIAAGFEADVVVPASEDFLRSLQKDGFITNSWRSQPYKGMVARSVVALGVREGNPKDVFTWKELTRQEIQILHPDPITSGVGHWVLNAIYGAGLKFSEERSGHKDVLLARKFLTKVEKRVVSLETNESTSSTAFFRGIGDVLLSSEHEIKLQQQLGRSLEMIIPTPTLLIEHPAAIVDKHVDKHDSRKIAEALVNFLWTKEAQDAFANYGFRCVDEQLREQYHSYFSEPKQILDIHYLGGWDGCATANLIDRGKPCPVNP